LQCGSSRKEIFHLTIHKLAMCFIYFTQAGMLPTLRSVYCTHSYFLAPPFQNFVKEAGFESGTVASVLNQLSLHINQRQLLQYEIDGVEP
jgi:hypothetical protein